MIVASVVTYNTPKEMVLRLIKCVETSSVDKLIVVDQSAGNNLKKDLLISSKIEYIHQENRGYGAGHNTAIHQSLELNADYHIVLNPDVYWEGDIVAPLAAFMDATHDCVLSMPKILYPDGRIQHLCKRLPTPLDLIVRRFIPVAALKERINRKYEMRDRNYNDIMEVPVLSGCFMFFRCNALRTAGLFDERFFLYGEDVDICRRMCEIGRNIYYPKVNIYHEYARSSYSISSMRNLHIRSMISYFNKWGWIADSNREVINDKVASQLPFRFSKEEK